MDDTRHVLSFLIPLLFSLDRRYFSHQELRDMFAITQEGLERSETQALLEREHGQQRVAGEELKRHKDFLHSLEGFAGISDHDLLFSKKEEAHQSGSNSGAGYNGAAQTWQPRAAPVVEGGWRIGQNKRLVNAGAAALMACAILVAVLLYRHSSMINQFCTMRSCAYHKYSKRNLQSDA